MVLLAAFITLVFLYSLVSARAASSVLTAPLLFAAAGLLAPVVFPLPFKPGGEHLDAFLHVAEIGLVLLLFTDASRVDLRLLKSIRSLPARLLGPGLLLTIILGGLGALVVFDHLTIWEAGVLGAILAPTDAGLGQVIVNSPLAPARIRQALNVEAGLNDGLAVPFLLFFMAMSGPSGAGGHAGLGRLVVEQLGYGVGIGVAIGGLGGLLLGWARRRSLIAHGFEPLGVVALPLLCMLASEACGASMFIASFVAGLSAHAAHREIGGHSADFAEEWGQFVNLFVFFLFGVLVSGAWAAFTWAHVLYGALSLTVVRMLPVALALLGARLHPSTVLFMGWFGPRGLASIVLGLVYIEHQTGGHLPDEPTIRCAVMVTVLMSIVAHGLSALPGVRWYSARLPPGAPERDEPTRTHAEPPEPLRHG